MRDPADFQSDTIALTPMARWNGKIRRSDLKPNLSIDPGTRALGYAVDVGGYVIDCGLYELNEKAGGSAAASLAHGFKHKMQMMGITNPTTMIELPRVYRPRLMKGDANDLIALALVVGALLTVFAPHAAFIHASDWKGQAPKDVMINRIRKRLVWGDMNGELERTADQWGSKAHNVWDAVGIALWRCGRMEK